MASRKILVQLDIAAASNLTSPSSGFVGFSAKADGLYQKIGTAPELRLLTSADVQNAILADGSITGAVSQAQTFTLGVKLSNLTQGYIPYASGATKLLSDSPIYTDGTNVGIGVTIPAEKLDVNGNIKVNSQVYSSKIIINPTSGVGWYRIASSGQGGGTVYLSAGIDNTNQRLEFAYNIRGWINSSSMVGSVTVTRSMNYNAGPVGSIRISSDGLGSSYLDLYVSTANAPVPFTVYGTNGASFLASPEYNPVVPTYTKVLDLNVTKYWGIQTTDSINVGENATISGNVGIGTTSPMAKLEVYGLGQSVADIIDADSRGDMLALNSSNSIYGSGGALLFGNVQSRGVNSLGFAAIKGFLVNGSTNTIGDMAFLTRSSVTATSLTERMRIISNGNVGIGTMYPTSSLHIKAGTETAGTAPIKLTSGVNLTTPESGAIEFSSSRLYFTPSTTRETLAFISDITAASHVPVTIGAIGSAPNSNGMSISGQTLSLQPASADYGGILTNSTQTIAGNKTFSGNISGSGSNLLTNIIIDTHPESSTTVIPFINNDIAYNDLRGGSTTVNIGSPSNGWYDGSPSYDPVPSIASINAVPEGYIIETTFHKLFSYGYKIGVSFGNGGWSARHIKVETYRTDTSSWETIGETTTNGSAIYQVSNGTSGYTISKMRFTFSDFPYSGFRIAQLWLLNCNSEGPKEVFVGRDGGAMYGTLNLNKNILTNIGNVGTNFIASTGGLNLAGLLTSNGGISNPSSYTQSGTSLNTFTGNIRNTSLTASKVVFTDGSKNLTSTGIGTASQFIKGDGSLDSNTYITSGSISGFVPYTGANDNVNLGTHNLSCNEITTASKLIVGKPNTGYSDGGLFSIISPSASYASFDFYSIDTLYEYGVVEIHADPQEGILLTARSNDNSSNSSLDVRYWELGFYTNSLKRLEIAQNGSINAFGNTITSTGGFIGNASTATKLETARTITIGNQSLSFDGTANLTYSLANIGVPTGSGVDGRITFWSGTNSLSSSANLTWDNTSSRLSVNSISLASSFKLGSSTTAGYVLTADANGNGTWKAPTGSLSGFVPYTGANDNVNLGTFGLHSGDVSIDNGLIVGNLNNSSYTDGGYLLVQTPSASYASLNFYSKDTSDGFGIVQIHANPGEGINLYARTNNNSSNSYLDVRYWELGFYTNSQKRLEIAQNGSINAFGNTITSTGGFIGNASTATKLETARTITIGNQSLSFDGTANLTYTLSGIGIPVGTASQYFRGDLSLATFPTIISGTGATGYITLWDGTKSQTYDTNLIFDSVNNILFTQSIQLAYNFKLGLSTTAGYVLTTDADGNGSWQAPPTGGGSYTLPTATASALGGVKIGSGITISSGVISVSTNYEAPLTFSSGLTRSGNAISVTSGKYVPFVGADRDVNLASYSIYAYDFLIYSDINLKCNIEDIKMKKLDINYKQFEYKTSRGEKRYGVIAQELLSIAPEFVSESNNSYAVKYTDLLIYEVAQLKEEVKQLKSLLCR